MSNPAGIPISEKLLLLFSKKPGTEETPERTQEQSVEEALSQLEDAFPDFIPPNRKQGRP